VGGASLTREGHWMAATLALGQGAALSHRSAAELWALIPGCSSLMTRGYTVLRFTWRQLTERRDWVARKVLEALGGLPLRR